MGIATSGATGFSRLVCADGLVHLTGPAHLTAALAKILDSVAIPAEPLRILEVTLSPDAQTADGAVDGDLIWSIPILRSPIATLVGQITGTVTTLLTRLLFVHAGVVAFEGRGMILVGQSGTGKTSTVAALLRGGATFLSDEVALLDPERGVALPFHLPMAVKPWTRRAVGVLPSGRAIWREDRTEFWLPHRLEAGPVVLDTVVLLRPTDAAARLTPLSPAAMLLALAQHASSLKQKHRLPEAFAGFAGLLRRARCIVLEAAKPAARADLLITLGRRPA